MVKSATKDERGVIIVDYSYVFALFAALFDLNAVADQYTIVLEPSWSGLCTLENLIFTRYSFPVFVQTTEPRDYDFSIKVPTNLRLVPVAANWWVDHRLMKPKPMAERDIDVIMVATWSHLKRHARVFRAISRLRRDGHRLRVVLVGYPGDLTADDIARQAELFGISDQIQMFEKIAPRDVAELLSRSRLKILWSRREGFNRAIVEAMLADVPVIVRRGLTYGYPYPYINEATGLFCDEQELPEAILATVRNPGPRLAPRDWVMSNMSCQQAVSILEGHLRDAAVAAGERWTTGVVPKVSGLNRQDYWEESARSKFAADYELLRSMLRSEVG